MPTGEWSAESDRIHARTLARADPIPRCPRVPLDNNQVERALRGAVIGRKNHYGSRSRRGTEVAALFFSLLESAKACGVDEKTYLLRAAHTALANPSLTLLPHDLRQ
jgi:transposase